MNPNIGYEIPVQEAKYLISRRFPEKLEYKQNENLLINFYV